MTYGELHNIVKRHPGRIEIHIAHVGYTRVYRGDLLLNLGAEDPEQESGIDLARVLDDNDGYLRIN